MKISINPPDLLLRSDELDVDWVLIEFLKMCTRRKYVSNYTSTGENIQILKSNIPPR